MQEVLLLKNKSENTPPNTVPPTENEPNKNNSANTNQNYLFSCSNIKIPALNVVSTRHLSHFLPNSSSLGRTGAILNPP